MTTPDRVAPSNLPGRRWLTAIIPGAGTIELADRLRDADRALWSEICMEHAEQRAEEFCHASSNDDLCMRDGDYCWAFYGIEFTDALRLVGCLRPQSFLAHAELAFVTTVNLIRRKRFGG